MFPPAVRTTPLAKSINPSPEIEPIVSDMSTSSVAPFEMPTAVESANEPVSFSEPALIDVAPVYVLDPERVAIPLPDFINSPPPDINPSNAFDPFP